MPSVLIVDDDRALRKLMRAYLEQESVSVIEADKIAPTLMLLDPSITCSGAHSS